MDYDKDSRVFRKVLTSGEQQEIELKDIVAGDNFTVTDEYEGCQDGSIVFTATSDSYYSYYQKQYVVDVDIDENYRVYEKAGT